MAETLENQALHLLGQVVNEDAGENIVALGMVKNVSVSEGKIDCIIAVSYTHLTLPTINWV